MKRQPKDYAAELAALKVKASELKTQHTMALGSLVQSCGADKLPNNVLAGVLLSAVAEMEQASNSAEVYAAKGDEHFQRDTRRAKGSGQTAADRPTLKAVAAGG